MRFVICGSMNFSKEMLSIKKYLEDAGHQAIAPHNAQKYASGEWGTEADEEAFEKKIRSNFVQEYYFEIRNADSVIIVNYDKRGIKNYVGGNSFLDAGFAHVLEKKIYFLNDIPEMGYSDDLRVFRPVILNGDIKNIFEK